MAGGTPLPDDIIESIGLSGVMSIANQPAILSNIALGNLTQNTNLSQQNAVAFQQTQNGLQATLLGKLVNMILSTGPLEAASTEALFSKADASGELAALKALLDALKGDGGGGGGGGGEGGCTYPGSIKPGEPGSSIDMAITHGTLRIDPTPGRHVQLIITDQRPAGRHKAPDFTIRAGRVYVFDNPEENVNVVMSDGNIKVTRV